MPLVNKQSAALCKAIHRAPLIVWVLTREASMATEVIQGRARLPFEPRLLAGKALYATFVAEAPEAIHTARQALGGKSFAATIHAPYRIYRTHYTPLYDDNTCIIGVSAVTTVTQLSVLPQLSMPPPYQNTPVPQNVCKSQASVIDANYSAPRHTSAIGPLPPDQKAPWQAHLHPDDIQSYQANWAQGISSERSYQIECRLKNSVTGLYRWISIQMVPVYDAAGGVSMWFGATTDIDKQKRDGQQLEKILENMNEAFFAVDKNWIILRVNKQHEIKSKIARQDQIGKNFLDIFFNTPASQKTIYWAQYQKAMGQQIAVFFEEYYEPLNIWTAVNVYPSADGGLAVFFRDISSERSLRQAIEIEKKKLEAIFVESPAAMALLRGPTFIFEKVNPSYKALMGNRNLVGKALHDALPELQDQFFFNLMTQVFTTGVSYLGRDVLARLIRRPGGQPENCYFDFTYCRIDDGKGNPYGIYIHAINVTHDFIAKVKTKNLTESLKEAIKARDNFLSSASHELKTPVTSLKMQLQMTRRGVKPEQGVAPPPLKLARTLDLSCRQVDRLTALIDDLLDVSRIESGKMAFDFEPVNISTLLYDAVEQFKEQFETAGCTVQTAFAPHIIITCDCFRIEQVITNLLTNAIKYGAGSHICIRAEPTENAGVRIVVADGGMGVAKEKQNLIFDRFERAISHNNVSGLGLGLYICKQIIEEHHGRIFLESELGKGSSFIVELPSHFGSGAAPATAAQVRELP